ncbi:U4/U6 small nuclear ribonucleoprotein prp4 [Coemansia sp. RSA 485]|nr:U4/U6 small nuclear ribonucleoprotein prp4 [Coemansia sp. RSA 485]
MKRNQDLDQEDGEIVLQTTDAMRADQRRSRSPTRTASGMRATDRKNSITVNKETASLKADAQKVKEDVFDLPINKDDDAEVDRLREERRRRRNQIIENHQALNTSTLGSSNTNSAGPKDDSALELEKKGKVTAISDAGVSAADYNPNADPNADDLRHRAAAESRPVPTSNNEKQSTAVKYPLNSKDAANIESDDEFDMFADDDDVTGIALNSKSIATTNNPIGVTAGVSLATTSTMVDNWDDPEGYYRLIVGELLDGRYLVQSLLGQGVFSSVVKAVDKQNNDAPVAIKIIRQSEMMHKAGIKEQRILQRLQSVDPEGKMHVVRLLGSFVHRGHMCLCFELMSLNLREIVRKYGRDSGLSLQAVRIYGSQLLLALDLLRRCEVVHGDIKPDNCFVSEQRNNVKLGDLGSACDVAECEITPYLVSRYYRAPEIILGLAYDQALDMWSFGVTLFELYTGQIMFPGRNNNHMLQLMMEARGPFSNKMLRKGQLWQQHFEDNGGGVMDLVVRPTDASAEVVQRMRIARPTRDIKKRILQATPPGSSSEEVQLALRLASLLERCLELSPDKRIAPIDALRHPFFAKDP